MGIYLFYIFKNIYKMNIKNNKCSFEEHGNIDAISFCKLCKVYMCNKCEAFHSKLLKTHQSIILGKNEETIFTGLCEEENHQLN